MTKTIAKNAPSKAVVARLSEQEITMLQMACGSPSHEAGASPVDSPVWFENPFKTKKLANEVLSSLSKKGYIVQQDRDTEEHALWVTQEGWDALVVMLPEMSASMGVAKAAAPEPLPITPELTMEDRVRSILKSVIDPIVVGDLIDKVTSANPGRAVFAMDVTEFEVQVRRAYAKYIKENRPDTEARQVYQDVNRHSCITVDVDLEFVRFIAMDSAGLDIKGVERRVFDATYTLVESYDIEKAAKQYLEATWISCSDQALNFLSTIVPNHTRSFTTMATSLKAKTAPAVAADTKAPKVAKFADKAAVDAAKPQAKAFGKGKPAAAPDSGRRQPETAAGRRAADKAAKDAAAAAAPVKVAKGAAKTAAAPAATKVAKTPAAPKVPRVSAADKKATQDALEAKQVVTLGKTTDAAPTECMKEMVKILTKNAKGLPRGKLMERFADKQKPGIIKMNIGWGHKLGVFSIDGKVYK